MVRRGPLGFLRTGQRAGREPAFCRWGGMRGGKGKPRQEGCAGRVGSQTLGGRIGGSTLFPGTV